MVQAQGYSRPAVITFKDLTKEIDIDTAHFYAARGTNALEDADAIFILGAPQASDYDLVQLAKMIYFDRDEAFEVNRTTRDVVYNYTDPEDGLGRAYPISGYWDDPHLNAILQAIREDEILQAAHRARPVNHPVDIWLLTNVPIGGLPPDELLTMRDVMGAPEGVNIFKWAKVQRLIDEEEVITVSDITELGIHRNTANKYLDFIAEMDGWSKAVVKTGKRGRQPRAVARA